MSNQCSVYMKLNKKIIIKNKQKGNFQKTISLIIDSQERREGGKKNISTGNAEYGTFLSFVIGILLFKCGPLLGNSAP